jgi:4-amino-4-deoxy-L-arabinose transferase-like glycosyltransferase
MRRYLPLALAALLVLTLLPGLAAVDATDEREARDLVTAYESTNHREWLAPIYGYEPFFEKPLPGYAPEVITRRLLVRLLPGAGRAMTDVAASRFVRALLAVALALAVTAIGTRAFGARSGWLAGCVLASSLALPLAARADGVQVYVTLLTWLGLGQWIALLTGRASVPNVSLALGWLALGAVAMTGGPLPALWPLAGFALYFALARRGTRGVTGAAHGPGGWRLLDPWMGVLVIVGVCLPWYGAMTAIHGAAFYARVPWFPYASGVRGSWLAGPALALSFAVVASFPWTPLLAGALADAALRLRRAAGPPVAGLPLDTEHVEHLLLALALAGVLPIALYPGPPLTAALPGMPAVALLIGRFADRVLDGRLPASALTHAVRWLAVIGTAFALAGLTLASRLPGAATELRLFSVVMFLCAWAPLLADFRGAKRVAVALFALPAALGAPLLHTRVLPALEPWLDAHAVAEAMQRVSPPLAPLVVFDPPPPSLRQALLRNFVSRSVVTKSDADVAARDGFVYAAFRPGREAHARAALAPLGAAPEVLARTPVLVLVRVPDAGAGGSR